VKRLAACVAACCLAAALAGAASGGGETKRLVIRLISDNKVAGVVDKAPKGKLSAGDSVTTTSTLRNQVAQLGKPKGALVGRDRAVQTFLSARSYTVKGYAVLPGGRVLFQGRVEASGGSVKVTGGTGRYAGATGALTSNGLGGTRAVNVYTLTLP
jgi:hypothetical protein